MEGQKKWMGAPVMLYSKKDVMDEELSVIRRRRARIMKEEGREEEALDPMWGLLGLSLSGGGIRSALFNLGVLQGLSRLGILRYVDMMTSVSGGGYIAGCLSALLSAREPGEEDDSLECPFHFREGSRPLFSTRWRQFPLRDFPIEDTDDDCPEESDETGRDLGYRRFSPRTEMRHLRSHSNYLLPGGPRLGNTLQFLGAVFLNFVAPFSWFTALVLTIVALYMGLAQLLEIMYGVVYACIVYTFQPVSYLKESLHLVQQVLLRDYMYALTSAMSISVLFCLFHLYKKRAVMPIIRFVSIMNILLWIVWGALIYLNSIDIGRSFLFVPFFSALFVFLGLFAVSNVFLRSSRSKDTHARFYTAVGTTVSFMALGALIAILPISIKKIDLLYLFSLQGLSGVALRAFLSLERFETGPESRLVALRKRVEQTALNILVILFVFLYATILGQGLDGVLMNGNWLITKCNPTPLFTAALVSAVLLCLLSLIDFNRLSNFTFYDMRLARAFLFTALTKWPDNKYHGGRRVKTTRSATQKEHCQIEPRECAYRDFREMKLHELHGTLVRGDCKENDSPFCVAARGPYHIICATLNLTGASDLRGLKRKTEQFIFSRLFSGSSRTGYVRTKNAYKDLTLARAIGISGAAVAPIMGRMTTRFRSFACTVLGMRLGQWLKNPRYIADDFARSGQNKTERGRFFFLLFKELVGSVDAGKYVYISDGGHCGDNLGIVPLLKRRARLIIASDAECDPHYLFNSLNSSLREIYVDEGIKVDIEMPGDFLKPHPSGLKSTHFLVGRILYPDRPWQASWLVVLKSSLTGDELAPILNYKRRVAAFPHETTANQFFTEEQFEAYRALGRHVSEDALSVVDKVRGKDPLWDVLGTLGRAIEAKYYKDAGIKRPHSFVRRHRWDDILRAMWDTEQYDFSSFEALSNSLFCGGDGSGEGGGQGGSKVDENTVRSHQDLRDDVLLQDFIWLSKLLRDKRRLRTSRLLEKEVPKTMEALLAMEEIKSFPGPYCQRVPLFNPPEYGN